MCDRYSFALSKEKINRRFEIKLTQLPEVNYNISPGQSVAVVTDISSGLLSVFFWGICLPNKTKKTAGGLISNINKESIPIQPYFKNLLENRRCLILADGFYCWKKISKKGVIPYRAVLKWNLPFAMAGIWDTQVNTLTGAVQNVCAILTTSSNMLLNQVDKKMPVVLPIEYEKIWLDQKLSLEEALQLLKPYPAEGMKLFPVSSQLYSTSVNSPILTQPAEPVDQFGNYILFPEN